MTAPRLAPWWRQLQCLVGLHETVIAHEETGDAVRYFLSCLHCRYASPGWVIPRARRA